MDYVWGQGISVLCWSHIGDGNMKELWDFNRSSAKSYLFFLIYFRVIALGTSLGQKTSEINQLETRSEINKYFPALVLENAHGGVTIKPWKPKGVKLQFFIIDRTNNRNRSPRLETFG